MISMTDDTQMQHDKIPAEGGQVRPDTGHTGSPPVPVPLPGLVAARKLPRGRNRLPWRDDD
jgi:hypothetical protein